MSAAAFDIIHSDRDNVRRSIRYSKRQSVRYQFTGAPTMPMLLCLTLHCLTLFLSLLSKRSKSQCQLSWSLPSYCNTVVQGQSLQCRDAYWLYEQLPRKVACLRRVVESHAVLNQHYHKEGFAHKMQLLQMALLLCLRR